MAFSEGSGSHLYTRGGPVIFGAKQLVLKIDEDYPDPCVNEAKYYLRHVFDKINMVKRLKSKG